MSFSNGLGKLGLGGLGLGEMGRHCPARYITFLNVNYLFSGLTTQAS